MISHAWRCIFVHQRKSAGTSVKAMFPDATGADRGRFNEGVLEPHWDEDDPTIRAYLKFTVIRNPWDRFISGWKHCRSTKHRSVLDVLENLPRESLLSNVLDPRTSAPARWHYGREILRQAKDRTKYTVRTALGREDDTPQRPGHEYRHVTRQQVQTVVYPDGRLAMDRVVFFEELDAGLSEVCRLLGKPWRKPPALRVRRAGDDYRRHFDDRSLAAFARAFGRDIEYWGYDFDTGLPDWPRRQT
ncbi:sulfotransferase family 2 domain-containing protein [Amaricoccus sp.]|uniref:sulfotransferase family 2 domain-containing protein n=1 Tax=Amaricoccus sp. TaxID=1872485 RepID=UPI001B7445B7|nr:sulfotransferase family 2 domain-containing protein [Amaricoccus sp.]MBP7243276.1 sulfotransferase family 2 domain-containing protein [Amaricoccus sp.]